ncbi:unnamed protein product [Merluccius merluccius]
MLKFMCALFTRMCFILVSLLGVYRVVHVKDDRKYALLTLLFLPLVLEMVVTLCRRKGKDYKWFSPAIFLFLISIIPSIWLLELHHHHNMSSEKQCNKLDSWEDLQKLVPHNTTNANSTAIQVTPRSHTMTQGVIGVSVCPKSWILALHMILLILLILGKWLLPIGGGVTRDELSQLLLIFVGTAADILEFTSETPPVTRENERFQLIYLILAVWTWSMLQFPLHLAGQLANTKSEEEEEEGDQDVSVLSKHSTDLLTVVQALFIHDGPFLVVRLIVLIYFREFNQMLVFFAVKNSLMIILSLYRLIVIYQPAG